MRPPPQLAGDMLPPFSQRSSPPRSKLSRVSVVPSPVPSPGWRQTTYRHANGFDGSSRDNGSLSASNSSGKRIGSGIFIVSKSGPSWISDRPLTTPTAPSFPTTPQCSQELSDEDELVCSPEIASLALPEACSSVATPDGPQPEDHLRDQGTARCQSHLSSGSRSVSDKCINWLEASDEEVEGAVYGRGDDTLRRSPTSSIGSEVDNGHHSVSSPVRPSLPTATSISAFRPTRKVSGPREPPWNDPLHHPSSSLSGHHSFLPATPRHHHHHQHLHHHDARSSSDSSDGFQEEIVGGTRPSDEFFSESSDSDLDSLQVERGSRSSRTSGRALTRPRTASGRATFIDQSPIVPSEEENAFWTGGSAKASIMHSETMRQNAPSRSSIWQQIEPQELEHSSTLFPTSGTRSCNPAQRALVLPHVTTMSARSTRRHDLRWKTSNLSMNSQRRVGAHASQEDASGAAEVGGSARPAACLSRQFSYSVDDLTATIQHHSMADVGSAAIPPFVNQQTVGAASEQHSEASCVDVEHSDEYAASESSASCQVQVQTATKLSINRADALPFCAANASSSSLFGHFRKQRDLKEFRESCVQTEPLDTPPTKEPNGKHRTRKRPDLRIDTGVVADAHTAAFTQVLAVQGQKSALPLGTAAREATMTVECPQCGHAFSPAGAQQEPVTPGEQAHRLALARVRARAAALAKASASSMTSAARTYESELGSCWETPQGSSAGNFTTSRDRSSSFSALSAASIRRVDGTELRRDIASSEEKIMHRRSPAEAPVVPTSIADEDDEDVATMTSPPGSREQSLYRQGAASRSTHSRVSSIQSFFSSYGSRRTSKVSNIVASSGHGEKVSASMLLSCVRTSQTLAPEGLPIGRPLPQEALRPASATRTPSSVGALSSGVTSTISPAWRDSSLLGAVTPLVLPTSSGEAVSFEDTAAVSQPSSSSAGGARPECADDDIILLKSDEGVQPAATRHRSAKALKILGLDAQTDATEQLVNVHDRSLPSSQSGRSALASTFKKPLISSTASRKGKDVHHPVISAPFNVQHSIPSEGHIMLQNHPATYTAAPNTTTSIAVQRSERLAAGPEPTPNGAMQKFKHALRRGKSSIKDVELSTSLENLPPLPTLRRSKTVSRPSTADAQQHLTAHLSQLSGRDSGFKHRRGDSVDTESPLHVIPDGRFGSAARNRSSERLSVGSDFANFGRF